MSIPQSGGGLISSRDQLAAYMEDGCKPKPEWAIGTEHEKFGFLADTRAPLPYTGEASIHAMLSGLRDRFGWNPVEESGDLIGLMESWKV
ncbi:MAG: glutamate--cysteine ligase, partial [Pseudomonadota bacterium]